MPGMARICGALINSRSFFPGLVIFISLQSLCRETAIENIDNGSGHGLASTYTSQDGVHIHEQLRQVGFPRARHARIPVGHGKAERRQRRRAPLAVAEKQRAGALENAARTWLPRACRARLSAVS